MKTPHRPDRFRSLALYSLVTGMSLAMPLSSALAVTSSAQFDVTAQIHSSCVIAAEPLDFGTYDGAVKDTTSHLGVTCNLGEPYTIGLSPGSAGADYAATRTMKDGSKVLEYQLFTDSSYTLKWGPISGTEHVVTSSIPGGATGSLETIPVYGRITAGQNPGSGIYHDTITATISY